MSKKTADRNMPIGKLTIVPDFLPPPEKLLPKSEMQKVTIEIDKETVDFFRDQAKTVSGGKYQRMMREVLRIYARKYKKTG